MNCPLCQANLSRYDDEHPCDPAIPRLLRDNKRMTEALEVVVRNLQTVSEHSADYEKQQHCEICQAELRAARNVAQKALHPAEEPQPLKRTKRERSRGFILTLIKIMNMSM